VVRGPSKEDLAIREWLNDPSNIFYSSTIASPDRRQFTAGTLQEEIYRILTLPYLDPAVPRCPDPEYGNRMLNSSRIDAQFCLRQIQTDSIWTYETYGKLFGPQGCGHGKTLIAIMCAVKAITARRHYRVAILVPPETFGQFTEKQIPEARQLLDFQGVAFYPIRGSAGTRMAVASTPGPGVWVYSYSSLSTKSGYDELRAIRATCYILDEAHNVARNKASRTKRLQAIWKAIKDEGVLGDSARMTGKPPPELEVVPLSGTLTKKSIKDYSHLAAAALGALSPAPLRESAVSVMAGVLDSQAGAGGQLGISPRDSAMVWQFPKWADALGLDLTGAERRDDETDEEFKARSRMTLTAQERLRVAYMRRLVSSPGVVATSDQGVGSSLLIRWVEPGHQDAVGSGEMVRLLTQVVDDQMTPNGDVIDFAMHSFKWLWELSSGFYNSLEWPGIEKVQRDYHSKWNKVISDTEAEALLEQAKRHNQKLQEYHSILRKFLDNTFIPHCDSPMLVAQEILHQIEKGEVRNRLPEALIKAYSEQRSAGPHTYPDIPERIRNPRRVCDFKIRSAVEWAKKAQNGILWFHHPIVGDWLHEMMTQAGIPHTYAPAGKNKEVYSPGIVIASYAHGTGKNLQHQSKSVHVELRREAVTMEQTISRTHRSGQQADMVEVDLFVSNYFELGLFAGTLRDADYMQATLGQRQRLCYASYDPVIPPMNPRLLERLGIIKNKCSPASGLAWQQITPAGVKSTADLFRPIAYGRAKAC
jgi:hypothetical protein